jgi:hypothetical protein
MKIRMANWLSFAGIALLLAGCTLVTATDAVDPVAAEAAPPAVRLETPAAARPGGEASVSGIPGDLLNAVLNDASERTGYPTDALIVVQAEAVTWNDGSLGCPEPGMFYTQALVGGYQIVVDADGQALDYRVQDNGPFRLCESNARRGGNRP